MGGGESGLDAYHLVFPRESQARQQVWAHRSLLLANLPLFLPQVQERALGIMNPAIGLALLLAGTWQGAGLTFQGPWLPSLQRSLLLPQSLRKCSWLGERGLVCLPKSSWLLIPGVAFGNNSLSPDCWSRL